MSEASEEKEVKVAEVFVSEMDNTAESTPVENWIQVTSKITAEDRVQTEVENHFEKISPASMESLICGIVGSTMGTAYKMLVSNQGVDTPELRLYWFNSIIRNSVPFFNDAVSKGNLVLPEEKAGQSSENEVK